MMVRSRSTSFADEIEQDSFLGGEGGGASSSSSMGRRHRSRSNPRNAKPLQDSCSWRIAYGQTLLLQGERDTEESSMREMGKVRVVWDDLLRARVALVRMQGRHSMDVQCAGFFNRLLE